MELEHLLNHNPLSLLQYQKNHAADLHSYTNKAVLNF
jgi:hypothetical protein